MNDSRDLLRACRRFLDNRHLWLSPYPPYQPGSEHAKEAGELVARIDSALTSKWADSPAREGWHWYFDPAGAAVPSPVIVGPATNGETGARTWVVMEPFRPIGVRAIENFPGKWLAIEFPDMPKGTL